MDKELQERFLDAVKGLKLKFPNAKISDKTGYNSGIVSEYLNSRKEVSESFLRRFCEVFELDFDKIFYGYSKKEKDRLQLEAELIELKAYNKALLLNVSKFMAKVDSSKKPEDYYEDLENDKSFFEKELIKNLK